MYLTMYQNNTSIGFKFLSGDEIITSLMSWYEYHAKQKTELSVGSSFECQFSRLANKFEKTDRTQDVGKTPSLFLWLKAMSRDL